MRGVCRRPRASVSCTATRPARRVCGTPTIDTAKPFTGKEEEAPSGNGKRNFIGEQLQDVVSRVSLPINIVRSVFSHVYGRGVFSFEDMIDLPRSARTLLQDAYFIDPGTVEKDQTADDGTRKWLCNFKDQKVESVFIPEATRGTLCVSSQVGCSFSCKFCYTGTQPVVRNLTSGEIVSQAVFGRRLLYDFTDNASAGRVISNLVFMGQGEPLYNYRNVSKAIALLTESSGLAFSRRKIIVSTSGVVPNIKKLGEDLKGIGLAISLHAVSDELRDQIVPINRQWKIAELLETVRNFHDLNPHNRTLFEYVMLRGVNDSIAEAKEMARLLLQPTPIPAIVNLIPFNSWPGAPFECSTSETISAFAATLQAENIATSVRWPRGRDILAACGQLRTSSQTKSAIVRA